MKVTVMYTLELDRQAISLTKEQAEALYSQLGNLLNKNTTTPYPIVNPPASPYTIPNTGPYPWPGVTSYRVGDFPDGGAGTDTTRRSVG